MKPIKTSSRRAFLKQSTSVAATSALVGSLSFPRNVHAAGEDKFNIALIGAGKRGTGAAADSMNVGKNVRLVAVADINENQANRSLKLLKENLGAQVAVPPEQIFIGLVRLY